MLLMARKNVANADNELAVIRREMGLLMEPMYKQLKLEMTFETFRNYFYRTPPQWLVKKAKLLQSGERFQDFGQNVESTGSGKLKIVGSVGAGGSPDSNMDENEMQVPIEFSNPEWRGMIVESDGRSMMPYIQPGDTVVIKQDYIPRLRKFMVIQSDIDPTQLYVKKVEYRDGKSVFVNTNKDSDQIEMKGLSLVGLVVGIISGDLRLKVGPYEDGISDEYMDSQLRGRLP